MLEINYEELVKDLESHVRAILEYCQLDWDERCLHPDRSARVAVTASYQQVRKPVYTRSIGRWQNYEHQLADLLNVLDAQALH